MAGYKPIYLASLENPASFVTRLKNALQMDRQMLNVMTKYRRRQSRGPICGSDVVTRPLSSTGPVVSPGPGRGVSEQFVGVLGAASKFPFLAMDEQPQQSMDPPFFSSNYSTESLRVLDLAAQALVRL
jgi:hypothetical protein